MAAKNQRRLKHVPQRMCVVCRQKLDKRRLTRVVRTPEATVVVDPTGRQAGRGAYVCDQAACWERAVSSNILDRALKTNVSEADKQALADYWSQQKSEDTV